jgi:LysR family nod box-dependent transcriptional activator
MRFRGLDLNLLTALQALLEERSVSAAADRLHISQPGMSASLKRLREYFDDDLLVANGRIMVPTPHALQIEGQLQEILKDLDSFVSQSAHFDPLVSTRRFNVVASEYISSVLLAQLLPRMKAIAPKIELHIAPPGVASFPGLAQGRFDLGIIPQDNTQDELISKVLMKENFVVVGCKNNPIFDEELTEEKFCQAEHIATKIGGVSFVEEQIKARGIHRRVYVQAASFLAAPEMVVNTRLLTCVHERLAHKMAKFLPIKIAKIPFPLEPMTEYVFYSKTREGDLGMNWLLKLIEEEANQFNCE